MSFSHPQGCAIIHTLIQRGVVVDCRDTDVMWFDFTPLYTGFSGVFDVVDHLRCVMECRE